MILSKSSSGVCWTRTPSKSSCSFPHKLDLGNLVSSSYASVGLTTRLAAGWSWSRDRAPAALAMSSKKRTVSGCLVLRVREGGQDGEGGHGVRGRSWVVCGRVCGGVSGRGSGRIAEGSGGCVCARVPPHPLLSKQGHAVL